MVIPNTSDSILVDIFDKVGQFLYLSSAHVCRVISVNAYNAAGMSRRQEQNVTNLVKNVNILEFGYYI